MRYSLHFVIDLTPFGEEIRSEIRSTMERVADAVGTVSPTNAFWASIHTSVLQIDAAGHRLLYRVLPRAHQIRIVCIEPKR